MRGELPSSGAPGGGRPPPGASGIRPDSTRSDGIRAVFFDVGQTLLRVRTSVGEVYAETAARHGVPVHAGEVARRFRTAWARSAERGRSRDYVCSDEILRREWLEIVRDTFPEDVPGPMLTRIFEELYDRFSSAEAWSLAPGARDAIAAIRGLGAAVGILSNWDSRLPRVLAEIGIADAFDFAVISFRVGVEKPHPAIFREALRLAGVAPSEALHVGDSWEADIAPARDLGLRALWIATGEPASVEDCPRVGISPDSVERVASLPGCGSFWARVLGGAVT